MALAVAIYHDVIINGIVDPAPKVNIITTCLNTLVWYIFAYLVLPSIRIMKSFEFSHNDVGFAKFLVVASPCLLMFGIPFTRFLGGALGYTRQRTLKDTFYYPKKGEWEMAEVNSNDWPVAPIYICNTVQHDIMDCRSTTPVPQTFYRAWQSNNGFPTTFNHFEITPHHWGNGVVGFWRIPDMRLSTAMSMSAAATSQTMGTGGLGESGWLGSLQFTITFIMGLLGMEMGRSHTLRRHGKYKPTELHDANRYFDISMPRIPEMLLIISICSLSLAQYFVLEDSITKNFENAPTATVSKNGICYGEECNKDPWEVAAHESYTTNVITYRYRKADGTMGFRTRDWLSYVSRYGGDFIAFYQEEIYTGSAPILPDWSSQTLDIEGALCADQYDFTKCSRPYTSIQNVDWFVKNNVHSAVYPLWPPNKMKCYNQLSYQEIAQFFFGYYNTRAHAAGTSQNTRPCTTGCCLAAQLYQSLIVARYACGTAASLTLAMFSVTVAILVVVFFAPPFSAFRVARWIMYSQLQMVIFRMVGFRAHIPDPFRHPPSEVFLTDGGHIDNSGAFPLIKRKCKAIVSVDSDLTRECSTIYVLMEVTRRRLGASWHVCDTEMATVDPQDYLLDFRLPRARYVGMGEAPAANPDELLLRERKARNLMLGSEHPHWRSAALKQLVSHVRVRDGHAYLYFMTDATLLEAFLEFPELRENFRIAQSIDSDKGLMEEDFLSTEVMHTETLRHSAHFKVRYSNGATGDVFYLRGETAPEDLREVRGFLKDYEPATHIYTTIGQYPSHSTLGEGYTWAHIDAYAKFSHKSTQHAWDHGLKELVESTIADPQGSACQGSA